jgi:hypothetical protein
VEWRDLFDSESSDKAYEEDQLMPGFGLAPIKTQGRRLLRLHLAGLHLALHARRLRPGLHRDPRGHRRQPVQVQGPSRDQGPGVLLPPDQGKRGANVYNRAFNSSYTGGDGSVLCVSTHSTIAGNQSNVLTASADLSEASLEDMCVKIMNAVNERGLKISLMPKSLIVPTALDVRGRAS